MKKIYLFGMAALLSAAALNANAQSLADISAQWGKVLLSSGNNCTTQGSELIKGNDALFMLAVAGTKTTDNKITFGDTEIATGVNYKGTSYNQNFILTKLSTSGDVVWTVKSVGGEAYQNEQYGAATADGGVVVAFKAWQTLGYETSDVKFVDAQGDTTGLNFTLNAVGDPRHYQMVVMKVSADGAIEWVKSFAQNHDPQPKASNTYAKNTGTGVYVYGLVTDAQGNIYIGGRLTTTMTVTKADGTTVDLVPHNVTGWNGSPQTSVGNAFILKLDANGNYIDNLMTGGSSTYDAVRTLRLVNGKLYAGIYVKGLANTAVTLGDKSVTTDGAQWSLGTACISTDLKTVDYFKLYESTLSGSAINNLGMRVEGDNIYYTALAKLQVTVDGTTYKTPGTRNGVVLKVDAATGEPLKFYNNTTLQAGYFDSFMDAEGNLYVAGWAKMLGATTITKFDAETLMPQDTVEIFPYTSTAQNLVADGKNLYMITRVKGNLTSKKVRSKAPFTVSATGFSAMVSGWTLPFKVPVTGIKDVKQTVAVAKVFGTEGALHVVADKAQQVNVYDLTGRTVARVNAAQGDNTVTLPAGLYIAAGQKVIVR